SSPEPLDVCRRDTSRARKPDDDTVTAAGVQRQVPAAEAGWDADELAEKHHLPVPPRRPALKGATRTNASLQEQLPPPSLGTNCTSPAEVSGAHLDGPCWKIRT